MALGNNLRKKKILPEQQTDVTPEKGKKEKKPAKKTSASSPVATKKKAKAKPKILPAKSRKAEKGIIPEISQEEFERRQALQKRYDQEIEQLEGKSLQLIVFTFNKQRYAVEIGKSREVVKTPALSELPHVPAFIPGLANIRGYLIVTIDLAHKFFSKSEITNTRAYTLVVEHGTNKLGLLLSGVPDTIIVPGKSVGSSSGILADFTRDDTYIKGLVRTAQGMIFLLDVDELIEGNKVRVLPAKNSA